MPGSFQETLDRSFKETLGVSSGAASLLLRKIGDNGGAILEAEQMEGTDVQ